MLASVVAGALLAAAVARGDVLPQDGPDKHVGVTRCSSPLCHNSVTPWTSARARLNEYRVWRERDHHSRAFASLRTPLGKRIGASLGLNPVRAEECLACHTDDVPRARRGAQFDVRDGVACEACHGGAERWLESHTARPPRQDDLERGMYRTEDARARAELCVACHVGTDTKRVTHRLLAAGHPRLSFELDTFTHLQPPHWVEDADYAERKGRPARGAQAWAIGQAVVLRQFLGLLAASPAGGDGWGEFTAFECASCHHDVGTPPVLTSGRNAPLGLPELTDAPFVLYQRVLKMTAPAEADGIAREVRALNQSASGRRDAAARLRDRVGSTMDAIARAEIAPDRLLATLADCDRRSARTTYLVAEEVTMAIEAALGDAGGEATLRSDPNVQALLAATASPGSFDPRRFRRALDGICARLR